MRFQPYQSQKIRRTFYDSTLEVKMNIAFTMNLTMAIRILITGKIDIIRVMVCYSVEIILSLHEWYLCLHK